MNNIIKEQLQSLVEKYKIHQVAKSSVPSGPDTSKFKATVSGDISIVENFYCAGDYYKPSRTIDIGLKVGSGINTEIRKQMFAEATKILTPLTTGHGWLYDTYGSNWCLIGVCNT